MCVAGITYYSSQNNVLSNGRIATTESTGRTQLQTNDGAETDPKSDGLTTNTLATTKRPNQEQDRSQDEENRSENKTSKTPGVATNESTSGSLAGTFDEERSGGENSMMSGNALADENRSIVIEEVVQYVPGSSDNSDEGFTPIFAKRELPVLYTHKPVAVDFSASEESTGDEVALFLAKLDDRERELAMEDDRQRKNDVPGEKLWTSVGFSAGSFSSPNFDVSGSASPAPGIAATTKVATNQAKASGTAYTMGVSFGARVSKRWVVQGGVNYMTQMSDYTTSVAVSSSTLSHFKPASLNEFRDNSQQKFVPTAPYSVNNSLRFISLPLQAGYLVVDRKLGVQVSAGVSTDMFIQNTIDPEGETLGKTTEGRGADSPYRSLNFSGLVGTEVSYRFADRYRLSLNPGVRYPFNSIYKDEVGVESTPLTFDVGLRFRYIFK
jgi:hypothetical protein